MVKEDPLAWKIEPPENFLNSHFFYRGVHQILWKNWPTLDKIYPNFFITTHAEKGLSVDWSKYATPKFTLSHLPMPELFINGIIELNISKLRETIEQNNFPLKFKHDPIRKLIKSQLLNRAHTLILGINKVNKSKIKRKLSRIAKWAPMMKPTLKNNI